MPTLSLRRRASITADLICVRSLRRSFSRCRWLVPLRRRIRPQSMRVDMVGASARDRANKAHAHHTAGRQRHARKHARTPTKKKSGPPAGELAEGPRTQALFFHDLLRRHCESTCASTRCTRPAHIASASAISARARVWAAQDRHHTAPQCACATRHAPHAPPATVCSCVRRSRSRVRDSRSTRGGPTTAREKPDRARAVRRVGTTRRSAAESHPHWRRACAARAPTRPPERARGAINPARRKGAHSPRATHGGHIGRYAHAVRGCASAGRARMPPAPGARGSALPYRTRDEDSCPSLLLFHELLRLVFLFCKNTSGQNMNTLLLGRKHLAAPPRLVAGAEADHGGRAAWEAGPLCTLSGA